MDANVVVQGVTTGAINLVNNPVSLIIGIVLIAAAILIIVFFKIFFINGLIGLAGFIFCLLIGIKLPFWLTVILSGIFGLAGLGLVLILKFFGIV